MCVYDLRISIADGLIMIIENINRCLTADESPPSLGQNDIAIQISLGTYKLFYEAGTEDVFLKGRTEEEEKVVRERALVRHEERKRSVWLQ